MNPRKPIVRILHVFLYMPTTTAQLVMNHIFKEDGQRECHLEAAVDSFPRTLKGGQMVDVTRAYAL